MAQHTSILIDGIVPIWSGPSAELCHLRAKVGTATYTIQLDGQGTSSPVDATDQLSSISTAEQPCLTSMSSTRQNPQISRSMGYRKTGNTLADLPYGSYHARCFMRLAQGRNA